jgi:6-pyruvoyl tetrahydropterin synthase/QueD family protein
VRSDFKVSVSKDYLVFSSAHFITFRGHQCETLHGHNYRLGVTVEGAVDDETLFVVDFSILKKLVRKLVDEIDHKVLLPLHNPKLSFAENGDSLTVSYFGTPTYVFPKVGLCDDADSEHDRRSDRGIFRGPGAEGPGSDWDAEPVGAGARGGGVVWAGGDVQVGDGLGDSD